MKKIPYGIINFEKLITNNYIYVDKTMYLKKLEDVKEILFYLKPGRFGKSLFTSMMYYYYDIRSKDKFDTLFKNTYVYKNPTLNKNNYYCLTFDFSGISMKSGEEKIDQDDLLNSFRKSVKIGIESFLTHYKYEYKIDETDRPDNILKDFLSYVNSLELDRKLYIIIDEYDNFTNAILEGDAKEFIDAVGNNGFVKSFYSVIKIFVKEGLVDRFFATGICPLTLNSMTTGFNIASDISTDREFNSMIGLTHAEVWNLLSEYDKKNQDQLFDIMLKHYDGYLFSEDLAKENRVFNATLVMYFLSNYERFHQVPNQLYDNNITVNYGKIDSLLKLQHNKIYPDIINEILKTDEIESNLITQFNLLEDIGREHIISLLFYFGYLTIKERNIYTNSLVFRVPNRAMIETYNNYFLKMLRDRDIIIDFSKEEAYIKEILLEGKIDLVTDYVSKIIELSSNNSYQKFSERDIQLIYRTLLIRNRNINYYNEYPCGNGFADIMIFRNSELAKYDIMIELKYIKKEDYTEELLKQKRNEAESQLKDYEADERIDKEHLKKFIVIFCMSEAKLLEEVK